MYSKRVGGVRIGGISVVICDTRDSCGFETFFCYSLCVNKSDIGSNVCKMEVYRDIYSVKNGA